MEDIKTHLKQEISEWGLDEFKKINKKKKLNKDLCFAFLGLGEIGELFTLIMFPNSIGSASKGGCSFDNREGYNEATGGYNITREVKFASLDGSKQCSRCKIKTSRFQTECLKCGGKNFKLINDSRWGISAKAHKDYYNNKYNLNEYILYVSEFNDKDENINLKCFKILSSNRYFSEYINNQYENGKGNTCNMLPYSWDFHLSGPIMLFDINIKNNGIISENFWNLDNTNIVNIPKNLIKKNKKNCNYEGVIPNEGLDYNNYIQYFAMKKKNLGKDRGEVVRK